MAPIAGWYDDPRDSDKLRYWDGASWTDHVTSKQPGPADTAVPVYPGAEEARQQTWRYGQPSTQEGQAQQPHEPPGFSQQEQPQSWNHQQPPPPWPQQEQSPGQWPPQHQPTQQQPAPQQPTQQWPGQEPPAGQWPPQQQWQQQWQQPWPGSSAAPGGVSTPDGARVTTWGKRFAARLLDVIFVFVASLPFIAYFLYRSYQALSDQMDSGTYDAFAPSADVVRWEMISIGIVMVMGLVYEGFCLRRWGATPGKRTLDIRVRAWDHDGKLPWSTVVIRVGFIYALAALCLVPVVGVLAILLFLLDGLWPLWDKRRQALHDKAAKTAVVEGWRNRNP